MTRRFDKSAYVKGMYLHGGTFGPDGRMVDIMPERRMTKSAPAEDPRLVYIKARTAELVALKEKLAVTGKQISELAAKVKRR